MVHNPGGHWHPGKGTPSQSIVISSIFFVLEKTTSSWVHCVKVVPRGTATPKRRKRRKRRKRSPPWPRGRCRRSRRRCWRRREKLGLKGMDAGQFWGYLLVVFLLEFLLPIGGFFRASQYIWNRKTSNKTEDVRLNTKLNQRILGKFSYNSSQSEFFRHFWGGIPEIFSAPFGFFPTGGLVAIYNLPRMLL